MRVNIICEQCGRVLNVYELNEEKILINLQASICQRCEDKAYKNGYADGVIFDMNEEMKK